MGVLQGDNVVSALVQYGQRPATDIGKPDTLVIGEHVLGIVDVVYTGVTLNRISAVNLRAGTFTADFNLWFRSRAGLDADRIRFANAIGPIDLGTPVVSVDDPSMSYRRYAVTGQFGLGANGPDIVRGRQTIELAFEHALKARDTLGYVVDLNGMGGQHADQWLEGVQARRIVQGPEKWSVRNALVFQSSRERNIEGDPRFPTTRGPSVEFSSFNLVLELAKPQLSLVGLVEPEKAAQVWILVLAFVVAIIVLGVIDRRVGRRTLPSFVARLSLLIAVVATLEIAVLDIVSKELTPFYVELVLKTMRALWWVVFAYISIQILERYVFGRQDKSGAPAIPSILLTATRVFLYGVAVIGAAHVVFNMSVAGVAAGSGIVAIIFGLALRSLILDAFAGLTIHIERPYRVGNFLEVHTRMADRFIGYVDEMNWRTTRIRTRDNNIIVVPNSVMSIAIITNLGLPSNDTRAILPFRLNQKVPTAEGARVLTAAAVQAIGPRGPLAEPAPRVRIGETTADGVEYELLVYYDSSILTREDVRDTVARSVMTHLAYAGLEIARPQEELRHTRLEEQSRDPRTVARKQELARNIKLFETLSPSEIETVAADMQPVAFEPGQRVVREGEKGDAMYVLAEGLLQVGVRDEQGEERAVARLGPGDFFGEMSLLAGEPRAATVTAESQSLLFIVSQASLARVIKARPEVMWALASAMAERRSQTEAALAEYEASSEEETRSVAQRMLTKIRGFWQGDGSERGGLASTAP